VQQREAIAEPVLDPKTSKISDKVDFAPAPGRRGSDGKIARWANIGGQPFVLTTWNDDEVIKEALELVKWWLSTDVQIKFAQNGGQSGLQSVMAKPDYASFRPWNRAHVEALPVPWDCIDGFLAAYWRRPERYLEPDVRACISGFARLAPAVVARGVEALRADLASGRWHERHADLLDRDELDCGYRLLVAEG